MIILKKNEKNVDDFISCSNQANSKRYRPTVMAKRMHNKIELTKTKQKNNKECERERDETKRIQQKIYNDI